MAWEIIGKSEFVDLARGLHIEYKTGDEAWDDFFYVINTDSGEVLEGGVSLVELGVPAELADKFVKEVKVINTQTDLEDFTGTNSSKLMPEGNYFPDEPAEAPLPKVGHNSGLAADRLLSLVSRIEHMIGEIKALQGDVKDIYTEAKSAGFDAKVLRAIIKIRAMDPEEVKAHAEQVDLYKFALGMD